MKKKSPPTGLSLIVIVALVLILSGCRSEHAPAGNTRAPKKTIIDRLGRTVEYDLPAKRIVSLSPSTTELLFAMELGHSIVGATSYCNYPEAALEIPRMGGGTMDSLSIETILAAKPDLVLAKSDTHQPLIDSLDRMGVRSMAVEAQSLSELFEQARWIGQITDHQDQAEAFVEKMKTRQEELAQVVERYRPEPRLKVFYEVWDDPLMSAGPDSFIDEILTLAGLENIVGGTAIQYPRISAETVVSEDPDIILAPKAHLEEVDLEAIRSRPGWSNVKAIRNGRVHLIPSDQISRCGPRIFDALAEIIVAAYPEASADELTVGAPLQ